ncbi:alkaline phosphatase family protein [Actinomadura fulvescens]|uniref:alkaline phosphatase family protein n=1 Tax=Actinomadura fulvescens TaxID=46160 RepID=UPI0031D0B142
MPIRSVPSPNPGRPGHPGHPGGHPGHPAALRGPRGFAAACAATLLLAATFVGLGSGDARSVATNATANASASANAAPPAYDHVVIVMEENRDDAEITAAAAPYIDQLRRGGASLTEMYGIVHPSQGNYFAQFHGKVEGQLDQCPVPGSPFNRPNLASKLIAAGRTFGAYMQGYPGNRNTCSSGNYVQRHAPWLTFSNVPESTFHTDAEFPTNFATLPTVSYVIPDNANNMHSASVTQGDTYLKNKLSAYAEWAKSNNSLLIVTWDESQIFNSVNDIETVFYGAHVKPGEYGPSNPSVGKDNHYNMLRTLEDMYGLAHHEGSVNATPITAPFGTVTPGELALAQPPDQTTPAGQQGSLQLQASGGTPPYAYSATGLPAGYSINASTGLISGTSSAAGASTVTVKVRDSASPAKEVSRTFTWTIGGGPGGGCKIGNPGDQSYKVGAKVDLKFTATGCTGTPAYTVTGRLPYVLWASGDTISGTVYQTGTFPVSVTVRDGAGTTSTADFKITVNWF